MRRRLALVKALPNTPVILFLDESTIDLDVRGQALVMDLITKLSKDGVTPLHMKYQKINLPLMKEIKMQNTDLHRFMVFSSKIRDHA